MCMCFRNWQSSDCSERTCLFGSAIVDTPKGDLDSSGEIDPPNILVAVNNAVYPYGAACQRMTCPGTITSISGTTSQPCNGHGQCLTLEKLAEYDHHSKYKLWSKSSLRGCLCDAGFYGGDCSMRKCKIAVDPMYFDDNSAIQYPFFFFAIMTTATTYDLSDGHAQPGPGEADDDTANTLEGVGYQYDTGSIYTPHVVRLVRGQQESNEGGQLAVLYYDPNYIGFDTQSGQRSASAVGAFRLLHPLRPLDDSPFNYYDLYVSNGRTQLIQNNSEAIFDFASNHIYTINTTVVEDYDGDISCEAMQKRKHNDSTNPFDSNRYCLDKQDYFFLIDPYNTSHNPDFLNLYQVQSFLTVNPMQVSEVDDFLRDDYQVQGYYFWRRHLLISDLNTNWANGFDAPGRFHVYRFRPNARNTYAYTSECANRGIITVLKLHSMVLVCELIALKQRWSLDDVYENHDEREREHGNENEIVVWTKTHRVAVVSYYCDDH
eukprot:scaffold8452_cov185-Ochromonas_danica.AAC.27